MTTRRPLTSEETTVLERIQHRLSERAGHSLTLNQLFQRWREFVIQVEQCYQDSFYEYTNDLSVRDVLEEILQEVPPSLREELTSEIRPWDERFTEATREIKQALLPNVTPGSLPWWWFRIPKNLGEILKEDLRTMGLLR